MELRVPADVEAGVVVLKGENLPLPPAGAVGSDSISNQSAVTGATVSAALDDLEDQVDDAQDDATQAIGDASAAAAAAALARGASNVTHMILETKSAGAEVGGIAAYAGTITEIAVVNSDVISTGDLVVTFSIGATPITGGVVTVPAATGAFTRVAVTPSAANVMTATDVIRYAVSGGHDGGGPANVTIKINPA